MLVLLLRISLCYLFLTSTWAAERQEYIFALDIPVYVPYSIKCSDQREIIKQEVEHFQQKCQKHTEKQIKHDAYVAIFSDSDFTPGKEPYRIDLDTKDIKKKWRGFLKLYKPNFIPDINSDLRAQEGAKKAKEGKIISNLDQETKQINRLIRLFEEESFGESIEVSREQFSRKMQITLLLNRMRSISATRNKSLKRYSDKLDNNPSVLLIRAFWEPKWVKRGKIIPLKEARHFFLEYLKRDPENALSFLIKQEGNTLGETLGASSHVPYRQLREAIRLHPAKQTMVSRLFDNNPRSVLFEAIHDSDLVQLRIQRDGLREESITPAEGLYSFYEKIIKDYRATNRYCPPLVTTGYRAAYEEIIGEKLFPWIFAAIEEDRYIRQELSKVERLMAYYAEPNCLYYVPSKMLTIPYTFLGISGSKNKNPVTWSLTQTHPQFDEYDPSESAIILHQLCKRYPDVSVLFDASHPAVMKIPARMRLHKRKETAFNLSDLGSFNPETHVFMPTSPKAFKVSENLSQSPLAFRDYAMIVYNQLDLVGGSYSYEEVSISRPNNLFTSLITSIFNAFDPVNMLEGEDISTIREITQSTYKNWKKRFILNPKIKSGNEAVLQEFDVINLLTTHTSQKTALEALVDAIYGQGIFEKLYQGAKALGQERFKHIYHYFVQGLATSNVKQSPSKAIEEFKKRVEIKEELDEVRRELFQDINESKEDTIDETAADKFEFPSFSRELFQQVIKRLYQKLGGNKDAMQAMFPVLDIKNKSAFYSALNLKNKSDGTYKEEWKSLKSKLSSFCTNNCIVLNSLFTES